MRLNKPAPIAIMACTLVLFGTITAAIPASPDNRPFETGFDCTRAKNTVENTVCAEKELADADLEMSSIYRETLSYVPEDGQNRLKREQIAWLAVRNKCGSTNNIISCLKDCYRNRIEDLVHQEVLETPSIVSMQEKNVHSFKVNFCITKSIRRNDYATTVAYPIPFETLPVSARIFTNNLIMNNFIAKPEGLADRFYGVTLENYTENVDFFMSFNPLGHQHEFQELWFFNLGVAQKGGGKRFPISSLIISREGTVLYGNGNEISPYWYIGEVKRTKAGITINIVNNRDGEFYGTYLYDQKSKKLVMIRSAEEKEHR